jgi:hypothetical protein
MEGNVHPVDRMERGRQTPYVAAPSTNGMPTCSASACNGERSRARLTSNRSSARGSGQGCRITPIEEESSAPLPIKADADIDVTNDNVEGSGSRDASIEENANRENADVDLSNVGLSNAPREPTPPRGDPTPRARQPLPAQ